MILKPKFPPGIIACSSTSKLNIGFTINSSNTGVIAPYKYLFHDSISITLRTAQLGRTLCVVDNTGLLELGIDEFADFFRLNGCHVFMKNRHDNVIRRGDILFLQTNSLVQTPTDAVANHGRFMHLPADHDSQSIQLTSVVANIF